MSRFVSARSRPIEVALLLFLTSLVALPATAQTPIRNGYRDFSFGSAGDGEPTGEKPESKMWWNDGFWWASMFNDSDNKYHIYRLDLATQTWMDRGILVDDRVNSLADTLWDAATQKLYVASHVFSKNAGQLAPAAERGRLYRYTYSSGTKTYALDTGFPVDANPSKTETLVLAKDSTGQLWMTYVDTNRVMVNHTLDGDDHLWGSPFVLPVTEADNLTSDDISSVISFAGKIGVLWSNQNTKHMYFAVHTDGDSDQLWKGAAIYTVSADDHINLKSLESDPAGQVFAAIKTSKSSALIVLLVCRSGSCDTATDWISHTVYSSSTYNPTRPIVLLDTSNRDLYIFSRNVDASDHAAIYYKKTSLDNPQFDATTIGTVFIFNDTDTRINNPTSAKQNLDATTGLAVLAGHNYYYHNHVALAGDPSPGIPSISSFSPTSGAVGTNVTIAGSNFIDATEVSFAGIPASFLANSDTQIQATVPAGTVTGKIAIVTPAGVGTSTAEFVVLVAPSIFSFSPTGGSPGTEVTISGFGFIGTTAVAFNGMVATGFTISSDTQVSATVPVGATTGKISVTNPAGTALSAVDFLIDSVAPETTVTSGPPAMTNSTEASFSFTASETGSTFACSLDGAAFTSCTSPKNYTALADGNHTFGVRATDEAGNTDSTPATHTWAIDTTAPETTITSGPPAMTNSTEASFSFTATEAGSTFACSLDGAAFASCTSPRSYASGLSDGSHTFHVRATDVLGNADATPASHTWSIDTQAPVIGNVSAPRINRRVATIEWSTNEPSTSKLEYGTTPALGLSTAVDNNLVVSHSVTLNRLQTRTIYYYRVLSEDAAGNASTSAILTFVTP